MDRRFALAVVLSFLVLMVFQVWFAPEPKDTADMPAGSADSAGVSAAVPPPASDTPRETARMAAPDTAGAADPGAPPPSLRSGGIVETAREEVTTDVDGDLFTARFTNRGGRLVSWNLKEYHVQGGDPVHMLANGAEIGLIVDVEGDTLSTDGVLFDVRREPAGDGTRLVYTAGVPGGIRITKTYTIPRDGYLIDLDVDVQGAPTASTYRVTWTRGVPPAEPPSKRNSQAAATQVLVGKGVENIRPSAFKKDTRRIVEGNVRWVGVRNKYFMASIVPPPETASRVVVTGNAEQHYTGYQLIMPLLQGEAHHAYHVYLGPDEYQRLKDLGFGLEEGVSLGWKLFRPISHLLLVVMVWMYGFIPNYGLVIIIISSLTKVLFYPLTKSSIRSMKAMQLIQPEVKELREKYKGDPKRMQAETMELYKRHKVNPVGGCLPMLLQMPVFIALYAVLANSITMRQAGFMLWIDDLSVPDTLVTIGGFGLHVLPIVMFLTTVAQQLLTPVQDPRQKMMGYMMPFVMLFIFYSFPAGLNLYWTVNNVLTVAQQWKIHREIPSTPSHPEPQTQTPKIEKPKRRAEKVKK